MLKRGISLTQIAVTPRTNGYKLYAIDKHGDLWSKIFDGTIGQRWVEEQLPSRSIGDTDDVQQAPDSGTARAD